jgi:predicted nucleotidyltransferase
MLSKEKRLLRTIAQKYQLELILLFGSRASKKNYKESDFDIAYLSKRDLNLNEEAKLIIELSPIFKSENIDLVNLKKAPPLLFYAITKESRGLFESKPFAFASLRAYAFKKYIETKLLYEEKFKRLKEKIK